jgi:ABC-2 type transport system ATP-binding protein
MTSEAFAEARQRAGARSGAAGATPPPPGTVPAVAARGLVKTFGDLRAVDGVDLTVAEGEIFGVLGPNGAGKTTMLQMLATLLPMDSGDAQVFGYDVRREPHAVRQLIGVTGQYASVDENLTGRENLWLFGRLQGLSSKRAHREADELLARFDLTEAANKAISQFSGGMRRRLDLAAGLITKPALIFLDEPTTGLDPRTRAQMWDTIRGLVADGCTVLLTTQYLDEADELADRIAVIDRGRKVAEGTPGELKARVGGSRLRVQLTHGADANAAVALVSAVVREASVVAATGAGFSVSLSDANQAADVLIALRHQAIDIANATVEQPSLDEVFLALTGQPSATSIAQTESEPEASHA